MPCPGGALADPCAVALAAALVVGLGGLWVVVAPAGNVFDDRFFGYSDESQLFISIACGYFVWDLVACIRYGWGLGFTVHGEPSPGCSCAHNRERARVLKPQSASLVLLCSPIGWLFSAVACLITYFACSYPRPFVQYCACFFLLYELSTPFMHVRQFCILLGKTDTLLFKMANVLFPLAFLCFRLVAGLSFSYDWAYHQWNFLQNDERRDTPSTLICCYLYVAVRTHCTVESRIFRLSACP